ncbi:MAG: aminotransferase class I/II-fold pyridoxal phosphate-dependent enzyme, partial [Aquabacterium sp.]
MTKKASGILLRPLPGEGPRQPSRRVWVYRTVLDAIVNGSLAVGTRLPAARQLAAEWGMARGPVDEAYEQLQIEGWLQRRVGDGTYVASQLPRKVAGPARLPRPLSQAAQRVLDRFAPYLGQPRQMEQPSRLLSPMPLFARAPMTEGFPLDIWRRLLARAWGDDQLDHMGYGPPAGLDDLRESVARHVSLTRGLVCTPQQVVVVNGPMQAIELIARVLLEPGDRVWIEDPGHTSLPALLEVLHMKVQPVPLDLQG